MAALNEQACRQCWELTDLMRLDYDIWNDPLNTVTSYINRRWRDSSALSCSSSFHREAWGKSRASLGRAALKAVHNCCRDWRNDDYILKGMISHSSMCGCSLCTLRAQMCGLPGSSQSSRFPGGHGALNGNDLWDRRAQVSLSVTQRGGRRLGLRNFS